MRPAPRKRRSPTRRTGPSSIVELLHGYVERGVFRSVSAPQRRGSGLVVDIVWHHGRTFRLVADARRRAVVFPELLPAVRARSPMMKELQGFLQQFESREVPRHRRIEPTKARLRVSAGVRGVAVGMTVRNGEWEYCARKLIHLAQEIYLVFLPDGPYQDYRVEKLGLDPDSVWT